MWKIYILPYINYLNPIIMTQNQDVIEKLNTIYQTSLKAMIGISPKLPNKFFYKLVTPN